MRPFERIVTEFGPMVLRVCRAVRGPDEAEDAWSETFLAALRAYPELDAYPNQGHDAALTQLAERISPRVLEAPGRLDAVARQIDEYFTYRRTVFDVPVDLRLSTGFRRMVLAHLPHIPYGATESYAQVATAAGSARAVRAVGTACAANPVPIVVPCHRVVRSDGSFGGYAGGLDVKRTLLEWEAAA